MNSETTIILCGGPINYSSLPVGTNQSNAMISVNGKPVIGWILDDLIAKGIRQAIVVLREQDQHLQTYLRRAYLGRMDIKTSALHQKGTILQSVQAGLRCSAASGLVRIILGDTLIRDSYHGDENFVYVGEVEDSRRWCLASTTDEGLVIGYADKQETTLHALTALAGYYHFVHGDHLQDCVEHSIAEDQRELSDVLRRYGGAYPIHARPAREWYDFGHIDQLVNSRRRLLQPRYFNSLSINPVLNTITKVSDYDEKLQDELDWYMSIPDELKVLTPRILKHERVNGQFTIVQEYYGYPTLAELYLYADLDTDHWLSILRRVLRIHQEFRRYPGQLEAEDLEAMYAGKTLQRLNTLTEEDPSWASLLASEALSYNGRSLRNIPSLENAMREGMKELAQSATISIVHGDFCFSNILFDINNQIIRLIDPRGSFGRRGIFGDARYDIAKLRHSVCSLYDYVVADMFDLHETKGQFEGKIYANATAQKVASSFDQMIVDAGYDLADIRLIEGLLFISMLPLHKGHPKRQRMMFLIGISLLNQAL